MASDPTVSGCRNHPGTDAAVQAAENYGLRHTVWVETTVPMGQRRELLAGVVAKVRPVIEAEWREKLAHAIKCEETWERQRDEARREVERLRTVLELVKSRNGWDLFHALDRRLGNLTLALNRASRLRKGRRWLRRRLHPDAKPLYSEAMSNMAGAVATTAAEALVNGRWAVREHEKAERMRKALDSAENLDSPPAEWGDVGGEARTAGFDAGVDAAVAHIRAALGDTEDGASDRSERAEKEL